MHYFIYLRQYQETYFVVFTKHSIDQECFISSLIILENGKSTNVHPFLVENTVNKRKHKIARGKKVFKCISDQTFSEIVWVERG